MQDRTSKSTTNKLSMLEQKKRSTQFNQFSTQGVPNPKGKVPSIGGLSKIGKPTGSSQIKSGIPLNTNRGFDKKYKSNLIGPSSNATRQSLGTSRNFYGNKSFRQGGTSKNAYEPSAVTQRLAIPKDTSRLYKNEHSMKTINEIQKIGSAQNKIKTSQINKIRNQKRGINVGNSIHNQNLKIGSQNKSFTNFNTQSTRKSQVPQTETKQMSVLQTDEKVKFQGLASPKNEEKFSKTTNLNKSIDFCNIRQSLRSARANSRGQLGETQCGISTTSSNMGDSSTNQSHNNPPRSKFVIQNFEKQNPYFQMMKGDASVLNQTQNSILDQERKILDSTQKSIKSTKPKPVIIQSFNPKIEENKKKSKTKFFQLDLQQSTDKKDFIKIQNGMNNRDIDEDAESPISIEKIPSPEQQALMINIDTSRFSERDHNQYNGLPNSPRQEHLNGIVDRIQYDEVLDADPDLLIPQIIQQPGTGNETQNVSFAKESNCKSNHTNNIKEIKLFSASKFQLGSFDNEIYNYPSNQNYQIKEQRKQLNVIKKKSQSYGSKHTMQQKMNETQYLKEPKQYFQISNNPNRQGISKQNSIGSLGSSMSDPKMPQPNHEAMTNKKEPSPVFKVSLKEVQRVGQSTNKDKNEIKKLKKIIVEKDEEIERLRTLLARKDRNQIIFKQKLVKSVERQPAQPKINPLHISKINELFERVQKDLEAAPEKNVEVPPSELSNYGGLSTARRGYGSILNFDNVSDYSKLESIHTKRESQLLLTDRKILGDRIIEKGGAAEILKSMERNYERERNGAISARGNNVTAPSFRELISTINLQQAQNVTATPRQNDLKNKLTPSNFYHTNEIFQFIENEMQINQNQIINYQQKELAEDDSTASPRP